MRRRLAVLPLLLSSFLGHAAPSTPPRPVLLTGEVVASDSQPIPVPASNSAPVVLRNFVAEGSTVKKGDLLLRIELTGSANVSDLQTEMEGAAFRAEREAADLEVKAVEAEKAVANAEAALEKAKVDAALPKTQVSIFDYDRYQAERVRAETDLKIKQMESANAAAAVVNRRKDGALEQEKLKANLLFTKARLEQSEVHAERDGVVVHHYNNWRDERMDEGSSAFPGNIAGEVLGSGTMSVRAWAIEADRPFLSVGQPVHLEFDALPGSAATGHVTSIAGAPGKHAGWGSARYFRVDIELPQNQGMALVPGMSVLVEPQAAGAAAKPRPQPRAASGTLTLEGEVASRVQIPISPPSIPEVWQYNLAQLAPEGGIVEAGEPVATFSASDVSTRLDTRRSQLKEKQRALEKLKLDQADAARSGELAVAEARANQERAERKAKVPKELIRRVDYDKLVIERVLNEKLARLAVRQRDAQAMAREAEMKGSLAETAQLQRMIATLEKGQHDLAVKAPRRGVVLYRTQFSGDKFTVGTQVFVGLSVATLADPDQLLVNAKVPEAQAPALHIGQVARVTVPGANLVLAAHVAGVGRTFHGKSGSQQVVVRDVTLEFDKPPSGVKPGTAVQVAIEPQQSQQSQQPQQAGGKGPAT